MSKISFIVEKTPVPPASEWYEVLDNTYWEVISGGFDSWNGTSWVANILETLRLSPIGSWEVGYRPTKIRVTHNGTNPTVHLYDSNSDTIAIQYSYVSDTEIDITFNSNDIGELFCGGGGAGFQVTNIEFFSTTDPTGV